MEKYYEIKYEKNKELTYASLWPQTWLEQVPANAPRLTAHLTISEAVVHHLSTGSSSNEFGNGDGDFMEIQKKRCFTHWLQYTQQLSVNWKMGFMIENATYDN